MRIWYGPVNEKKSTCGRWFTPSQTTPAPCVSSPNLLGIPTLWTSDGQLSPNSRGTALIIDRWHGGHSHEQKQAPPLCFFLARSLPLYFPTGPRRCSPLSVL